MSASYKLLARGGMGFIIKPNIDYGENKNTVSKLFIRKSDALEELSNHKLINRFDEDYKYHLKILDPIECNEIQKTEFKKLRIDEFSKQYYRLFDKTIYYINYENGGISLYDYLHQTNTTYIKRHIYVKLIEQIFKIIEVIKELIEYKYIHHDLKHQNILVDADMTLKIIDFGLMEYIPYYRNVCTSRDNINPFSIYLYFPFEIEYYNISCYEDSINIAKRNNYRVKIARLKSEFDFFFISSPVFELEYHTIYNNMITKMQTISHDDFLNATFYTFDIYTLGLCLVFLTEKYVHVIVKESTDDFCDRTEYHKKYSKWMHFEALNPIILRMITPNVFERIGIDELLIEFEKYVQLIKQ